MAGKHRLKSLPPMLTPLAERLRPLPKIAERFYQSAEWRSLAARVKAQRGGACEQCGSRHRVIADHIVERRDGGADLDPANIELLCQACHNRKTASERGRRASGIARSALGRAGRGG